MDELTTHVNRFCRHFRISEVGPDAGHAELARAVANYFEHQVECNEDEMLVEFATYVLSTFEGRFPMHEDEKRYAKRLRRKSRKPGSLSSDDDDGGQQTYCICRHVSFGEMIACDDPDCDIEWFHVECVGLKPGEVNRGTWYCPRCTEVRAKATVVTRGGRGVKKRFIAKE